MTPATGKFPQAQKIIERATNIILATHIDADGDAIGSMLALKLGLEKIGKNITAFCATGAPPELKFLPESDQIKSALAGPNADSVIGLDYGSVDRLRLPEQYPNPAFPSLTFDHHLVGRHVGLAVADSDLSSTSELIYFFLNFLGIGINPEIALCLLCGIFDDTGGFRHPNTNPQTLQIVSALLLKGASLPKIAKNIAQNNWPTELNLYKRLFTQFEIDEQTGLAFSFIDYRTLNEIGTDFRTSNAISILSAVPQARLAVLLTEKTPGHIDGTLRSQADRQINVAEIARAFGGGGHALAAGFTSDLSAQEIVEKIKALARKND